MSYQSEVIILEGEGAGHPSIVKFVHLPPKKLHPHLLTKELHFMDVLHTFGVLVDELLKTIFCQNLSQLKPKVLPQLSATEILLLHGLLFLEHQLIEI